MRLWLRSSRRHLLEHSQLDIHHTRYRAHSRFNQGRVHQQLNGGRTQVGSMRSLGCYFSLLSMPNIAHIMCTGLSCDLGLQLQRSSVLWVLLPEACFPCVSYAPFTPAAQRMGKEKGGYTGGEVCPICPETALKLLLISPFRDAPSWLTDKRCGFGYAFFISFMCCATHPGT